MELKNSTIFIMGGADGLGLELAKSANANGAKVHATGPSHASVKKAQDDHPNINWQLGNFANTENRKALASSIISIKPDVVIFNQALFVRRDFAKTADPNVPPIWLEVQDKLTAPMEITQDILPALMSGALDLCFVTTDLAGRPNDTAVFRATQAGLSAFIASLRAGLASSHPKLNITEIRVPFADEFSAKAKANTAQNLSETAARIWDAISKGETDIQL